MGDPELNAPEAVFERMKKGVGMYNVSTGLLLMPDIGYLSDDEVTDDVIVVDDGVDDDGCEEADVLVMYGVMTAEVPLARAVMMLKGMTSDDDGLGVAARGVIPAPMALGADEHMGFVEGRSSEMLELCEQMASEQGWGDDSQARIYDEMSRRLSGTAGKTSCDVAARISEAGAYMQGHAEALAGECDEMTVLFDGLTIEVKVTSAAGPVLVTTRKTMLVR